MDIPPFTPRMPPVVSVEAALEPAYNALLSLALLTAPGVEAIDPWVTEAANRLTPQQRRDNRLVFEGAAEALVFEHDAGDFPAYVDALAAQPPSALRRRVPGARTRAFADPALQAELDRLLAEPAALRGRLVAHLRAMWQQHLAAEWRHHAPNLKMITDFLNRSVFKQPAWSNKSAGEAVNSFIRRQAPESALTQLGGVQRVVFVLSPHAGLHVDRFGSADAAWVFVKVENHMLRRAPLRRAEVLGPLGALADDTRLRILEMLAAGDELRAQDLIARLGVSQPNVSRHLKQLSGAGFVDERRAGDANKLYRLRPEAIAQLAFNLSRLLTPENARAIAEEEESFARAKAARSGQPEALQPYLDPEGRVTGWPIKQKAQEYAVRYLAEKVPPGREFTEKEFGALLRAWFLDEDVVTVRRTMYEMGLIDRTANGSKYWRRA